MELMLVLVLLGLFSTMVGVRLDGFFKEGDLRFAARLLTGEIVRLRAEAVRMRVERGLTVDLDQERITAEAQPEDTEWLAMPPGVQIEALRLLPEATHRKGRVQILFWPNGCVQHARLVLRNQDDETMTLVVHPLTGQVTLDESYSDRQLRI
jgi:hypothetical protein